LALLFWIFALNGNYNLSISPFFVLFLTVERILIIRFPLDFKRYQKYYIYVVILLAISLYSISFAFFLAELPLDPKICEPICLINPKLFPFSPEFASFGSDCAKIQFPTPVHIQNVLRHLQPHLQHPFLPLARSGNGQKNSTKTE
jgi:hypothetical protein